MSVKASFKVDKSPDEVVQKAVEVIKNNVPSGTHLDSFRTWEGQGRMQAIGESASGIFHKSAVWVETRREKDGTVVDIHANDDKSGSLVEKLRNRL